MDKEKFYITTAIAYTSKKPHIGNTYEIILTDAIARYNRLKGKDVYFLTGTDEHGQKIQELAENAGITPKAYVDNIAGEIKNIWDLMDTTYDKFIRTTDDYHENTVQKIFKKLYEQGDIYLGEYEGSYCTPCESFFTESQLVDGKCPDCGREVKKAKEEAYFLKCSKYQDRLIEYIESHPEFIEPESRKKEIMNNFLKAGLQDLCVSRTSFTWGVPVSFNEKHVTYVWIDALSNYITALGYTVDEKSETYNKNWPADLHVIGKDILRFHAIYWPIILMALGESLPKKIYAHGWMLFGNDKMSKSKGNVIYADELAKEFGTDAVRYFCLSEMPYSQDGNITYESVINRYNTDLANTLGNLVNRSVTMVNKYFDGNVYVTEESEDVDNDLKGYIGEAVKLYKEKMDSLKVSEAVEQVMNIARRSNKYIDETTPWILAKTEEGKERLKTVLYNLVEAIRIIAVMLEPFMPTTSKSIMEQINSSNSDLSSIETFGKIENNSKVGNAKVLFARIDEKEKLEELNKKMEEKVVEEAEKAPEITIEEVEKVEMKVAQILSAEKIEGAKKLYKLEVDLGTEKRTVVSGLVPYYKEEELIGKKVAMITNLKPAKLRGIESNGMLLAAGDNDVVKVLFVDDSVPLGEGIH
ncbi:MAG: methionine--tRNA ligase [Clostridia bacterium]|nr:methionine--tRNA ligase [Clostridia bacterium]